MEHSQQQFETISAAILPADLSPVVPASFDWAALRATREQRITLQTALIDKRIAIISERHMERERVLASLNLPIAPFSGSQIDALNIGRDYLETIQYPNAKSAIALLKTGLHCLCAIGDAIRREWSETDIDAYYRITGEFAENIAAELDTLQLLAFELDFWTMLINEPLFVTDPVFDTPFCRKNVARTMEQEIWGWEDGNLSIVVENRGQLYRCYRISAEVGLRHLPDGEASDQAQHLLDLLTRIEQEHTALRSRAHILKTLRGSGK